MNSTTQSLIEYVRSSRNCTGYIADVRIGLGYTGVKLDSGSCGIACTLRHALNQQGCSVLPGAGTILGTPVSEAVQWFASENILEAAIGLAAINALAEWDERRSVQQLMFSELLHLTLDDQVAMIGYIAPIVKDIRSNVKQLFIFDEALTAKDGIIDVQTEPCKLSVKAAGQNRSNKQRKKFI